jgi:hypothetical protein
MLRTQSGSAGMLRARLVPALALALAAACAGPPFQRTARLRDHVETLAAPELAGRLTGSEGERLAARYLEDELARLQAQPLPGAPGLRLPFEFAAGTRDAGSSLRLDAGGRRHRFEAGDELLALSFSSSRRVSGPVVFAGYGLSVPDGAGEAYDSYAGLDVAGKLVLVLRYSPEDLGRERRAALSRYAGLRYKALAARERGAAGLLVVSGPRSPNAGRTVPMTFDTAVAGSGIAAVSVGGAVAEALFAGLPPGTLERTQRRLDAGDPHAGGFELPGVTATLDARVARERREGVNVVGLLPGSGPDPRPLVLLGAHYDHLGPGLHGGSLAREAEQGRTHPGADDNASGVAAVLEIAAALAREPAARPVAVAFWSGEELGLLGSTDFAQAGILAPEELAAYLNFDMVGRVREGRLAVHGSATSGDWPHLLSEANASVGLDLLLRPDPFLPTDSTVFYAEGVPVLTFFSGAHADYHRPTDIPERLHYAGLFRVARLGENLARALSALPAPPAFAKVEPSAPGGVVGAGLRAWTGTVPDYTSEAEGLRLADVVAGGPAARAGLRAGDCIVEFGGQRIANIYDYTYALEGARLSEPVRVLYLRDGERRETLLTPEARP